jgi:hypothetical protein
VVHDDRYFAATGYRIDDDTVWGYFGARGQLDTFGYPVSRTFFFLGCRVQVFQRVVAQVCNGRPALLNLLDPEIFRYTQVNGSTFPSADDELKAMTPRTDAPNYATAIVDFVRTNAPDSFEGQSVNFGSTFFGLIRPEGADDDIQRLGLLNLEVWGAPISRPTRDPSNDKFIYQRFQRGIMHYDAATGVTRGILLADYLKAIVVGQDLPVDLAEQAQGSQFFQQYCPGVANWLCRAGQLPGTDLTFAFEPG